MHFDPLVCLPHEIISHIFEYCEPTTLVNASKVSKTWRDRALAPPLWRRLFNLEGWTYNTEHIRCYEENTNYPKQFQHRERNPRTRLRPGGIGPDGNVMKRICDGRSARRWATGGFSGEVWDDQTGAVEADEGSPGGMESYDEEDMDGVTYHTDTRSNGHGNSLFKIFEGPDSSPITARSLILDTISREPKLNWQYIYDQRLRLEYNWTANRFTNFRLPHPDHPKEAHSQCVYTIQFSKTHLVSGSRDKSVRVWDLNTQRLKYPALLGHQGSVLCLQFDDRLAQDVIISGGSDADIIIWQLSTGEMIKRMKNAHLESVLNLRFDDRYLVTCSKDKTIKVWNRKELRPTDAEYPRTNVSRNAQYPDYIINIQDAVNITEGPRFQPLPVYTLLMTLDGHNAAVNAIQIYKNEIVSASGDRKIMLWDIPTGTLVRTFLGHLKGIACVQYDGRRIVSGSSDHTVRIFDSKTASEVATLGGHRDLVRTVQAEFGDSACDFIAQEKEAMENDRHLRRNRIRNLYRSHAESWLPKNRVYGAKLPPGGGGNRWSKVISGSYDETVMIWRIDKDGHWFTAKELRQEDALRATASKPQSIEIPAWLSTDPPGTVNPQPNLFDAVYAQLLAQEAMILRPEFWSNSIHTAGFGPPQTLTGNLHDPLFHVLSAGPAGALLQGHTQAHHAYAQRVRRQIQQVRQIQQALNQHAIPVQPRSQQQAPVPPAAVPHIPAHLHPQHPHFQQPMPHQSAQNQNQNQAGPNSRVFKLQFDARRIICCSQEPVIVGWDFANGDADIIEASQFFGEPC